MYTMSSGSTSTSRRATPTPRPRRRCSQHHLNAPISVTGCIRHERKLSIALRARGCSLLEQSGECSSTGTTLLTTSAAVVARRPCRSLSVTTNPSFSLINTYEVLHIVHSQDVAHKLSGTRSKHCLCATCSVQQLLSGLET
ncbi:hypothetical protein BV20DRAFT_15120 [Pilatotrama ljubarskyi]|nr:hypothetical protein BV20DRAFT_15120 [Pilatotrama ljubarskyi]